MSMKLWERQIIEYRPSIEDNRSILSIVIKRMENEFGAGYTYIPTEVMKQTLRRTAFDVIDKILAALSQATALKNGIEKELVNHPRYIEYKKALADGDDVTAREIHFENVADIGGHPSLDVYPIIVGVIDELEDFLDYTNDELFGGELDYNHLEPKREEERQQLESLVSLESEDLSHQTSPVFTEQQQVLINRVIQDPNSDINSVQDYINQVFYEKRKLGSPRINYDILADRAQVINALGRKADMFFESIGGINDYVYSRLGNYVNEDIQGSLEYITSLQGSLGDMKESTQLAHRYYVDKSLGAMKNMYRVGDENLRPFLDKQLSAVRKKKSRLVDGLRKTYASTTLGNPGTIAVYETLREGIRSANNLWKFILTEHVSNTDLNEDQFSRLTQMLDKKKNQQMIHHYVDFIGREFDFEHRDKELKTFVDKQGLHSKYMW